MVILSLFQKITQKIKKELKVIDKEVTCTDLGLDKLVEEQLFQWGTVGLAHSDAKNRTNAYTDYNVYQWGTVGLSHSDAKIKSNYFYALEYCFGNT